MTERRAAGLMVWKSTLDCTFAIILMFLTGPLVILAMLLVRLTSKGWPIYSQDRLGLDGRVFTIYKIRTMYLDCERLSGPRWSTPGDSRVTPIGRFLRSTHIDELPQLFNIIRGEMSLVGPRPERPVFANQLERALPCYRERLSVRPGVTGLAQVQLPPDTDLESVRRKLACDLFYVKHVSPWLDFRIMIGTALGISGVPFKTTRELLGLPGGDVVESAYRDLSGEMDILPQGAEAMAQMKPA